ncbi:MAG: hypothetical protein LBS55_12710 [Prevotellaceae bacterium]|jgi:uncharacterized protein YciU (UPF0263 family)|nr:hypothetical protein [Prevotellaceae bacterium]
MKTKNYWGYRINKNEIDFFAAELEAGRLRQGWGWDEEQDLLNMTMDEGAGRNRAMLKVKKGDILLVPHLPVWEEVAIVEATEDWEKGYRFEIDPEREDYGHIFPAKLIKSFTRNNDKVTEELRATLRNLQRFWNISRYAGDVEELLSTDDDLTASQEQDEQPQDAMEEAFDEIKNYWGYRIDKNQIDFFATELDAGRLRQGWGWDEEQDLLDMTMDEGAGRNLPMLKVKKGDILLVPHLPVWEEVAIVEATEDWKTAYRFEIDPERKDYGHIFPAKLIKSFTRNNNRVAAELRSTFRNLQRFWNINHCAEDVEELLSTEDDLATSQEWNERLEGSMESIFTGMFKDKDFADKLYDKLNKQFANAEWEHALVHGLQQLFPLYNIEKVGGPEEQYHGTDILVKLPGILPGYCYAIAIQVKDYKGFVNEDVIAQINKADKYWQESENVKLIDKIVIITKAGKEENLHLSDNDSGVKFIFAGELKALLLEIGKRIIGKRFTGVE